MPRPDINASDPVFEWAERTPWAVAIIEDGQVVHYRTLRLAILRAMAAFSDAGCTPGHVVGISMEGNVALQLVVSLALARTGIAQVWLPLSDPREYRERRAHRLRVVSIVADCTEGSLASVTRLTPEVRWLSDASTSESLLDLRINGTDRALILTQSSGTTGVAKDTVETHEEEMIFARRANAVCGCRPGERYMTLTDIRFWAGLTRAWRCLSNGGAFVVPPPEWTVTTLLQFIDRTHVTHLACTPMHIQLLLAGIDGDNARLPGLRQLRSGTAALPLSVLLEVRKRISPNLYMYYGTNEAGTITAAPPELLDRYPECAGLPLDGIELEVVDQNDQTVPLGSLGKIRVRGEGIDPRRILASEDAGVHSYKNGWNYTGDIGYVNAGGVLFLKGRSDDVMNFDGIMVGPSEIESVLSRHPAIADSAAFPLPSAIHQEVPAAAIVLRHPVPMEELEVYCRQHLAIRTPRMFFVMDVIPRNPMGKILRRRLTELAVEHVSKESATNSDVRPAHQKT